MQNTYFLERENHEAGTQVDLDEAIANLAFNEQGLVPVITQDYKTKDMLMMAWMNREAIKKTVEQQQMVYWSRSRNQFWKKGETSGHTQALKEMRFDCDGDAILCLVEQIGAACHTGRRDCFYWRVDANSNKVTITSSINSASDL